MGQGFGQRYKNEWQHLPPYKNKTGQGKVLSPPDPFPGWFPLQHSRLWLDCGRLHSRRAEVSYAAAGEVPLHSQACSP